MKNSNFFRRDSYDIIDFSTKFYFKNMNSTYEYTLEKEPKVKMKIFGGTKNWRNFFGRQTKS